MAFLHPALGRFMQRDPMGYVDGMNVYQFVKSNPVSRVDPQGLITAPYPFVWDRGTITATLQRDDDQHSSLDLRFKPNLKVITGCLCTEISFVQYVDEVTNMGNTGNFIRDGGDKYGYQTAWTGDRNGDAHMWDSPGAPYGTFWLYVPFWQKFESTAVCRKGLEAGKSYGTVTWSHTFTKTSVVRDIESSVASGPRQSPTVGMAIGPGWVPYQ